MKKILKLFLIGIPLMIVIFILVLIGLPTGYRLLPNAQRNYTIHYNEKVSLDPKTELFIQIKSGKGLLLKGRNIWIVAETNGEKTISPDDVLYYYDIKKQAVFVRDYDENNEIIDKEVSPDVIKGISLHKDGIVLTSKKARVFSVTEIKDYDITFQNISDVPLTFIAIESNR